MAYEGAPITLDAVTYQTGGSDGRGTTIRGVTYLGVIQRKSDGFTTLSVRKAGASRAFNIEAGSVLSVTAHGREWRPQVHPSRWMLLAAEMRSFIERTELEDWAKPYFDPHHEKHHKNRTRYEDSASAAPASVESPRVPDWAPVEPEWPRPGLLTRFWRKFFG